MNEKMLTVDILILIVLSIDVWISYQNMCLLRMQAQRS
jgi:hypothetical protein